MAGPFTETFNAANGTAVSSLSGWAKAAAATSPVVQGNGFCGGAVGEISLAYYNTAVAEAHYAKSVISARPANSSAGPAVRLQSASNSAYYCLDDTSNALVYCGEIVNGTATDWDAGKTPPSIGAVNELVIDAGATSTVYYKVNGSTVATYTGKTALTGGFAGISSGNAPAAINGDTWEGGDVPPTIQPDTGGSILPRRLGMQPSVATALVRRVRGGSQWGDVASVAFFGPKIFPVAAQSGVYTYSPSGGIVLSGSAALVKGKAVSASGGLTLSGTAERAKGKAFSASGGVLISGTASIAKGKAFAASGGMQTGGASSLVKGKSYTAIGGLSLSGAASLTKTKAYSASGGIVAGGLGTTQYAPAGIVSYTWAPSGGLQVSGTAGLAKGKAVAAQGGLQVSGTAGLAKSKSVSPQGGLQVLGTAGLAKSKALSSSGGIVFAGLAATQYAAAGVAQTYVYAATGGISISGASFTDIEPLGALPLLTYGFGEWKPWPAPRTVNSFAYASTGGLSIGGEADTRFDPVPLQAFTLITGIRIAVRGMSHVEYYDHGATIRRHDDDWLALMALRD